MGHNETQKKEETNIAYMLSEYLSILEKPRDFDPFGQTGLPPLATI